MILIFSNENDLSTLGVAKRLKQMRQDVIIIEPDTSDNMLIGIDKEKILNALSDEPFSDFEDCLQKECAVAFQADYIVTRNCDDFKSSRIPCIEPLAFCKML